MSAIPLGWHDTHRFLQGIGHLLGPILCQPGQLVLDVRVAWGTAKIRRRRQHHTSPQMVYAKFKSSMSRNATRSFHWLRVHPSIHPSIAFLSPKHTIWQSDTCVFIHTAQLVLRAQQTRFRSAWRCNRSLHNPFYSEIQVDVEVRLRLVAYRNAPPASSDKSWCPHPARAGGWARSPRTTG